jgi:integrase
MLPCAFARFRPDLGPKMGPKNLNLGPRMSKPKKLTDAQLRAWLKNRPVDLGAIPDGTVPNLSLRLGALTMTWSLKFRVRGEGGVTKRGRQKNGKLYRATLGEYPAVTLEAVRSTANTYLDQAKRGINPLKALEAGETAGGLTVARLAQTFITDYAKMRELRALRKYEQAIAVHIVPHLGGILAAQLTREQVRDAVKKVMVKQPRGEGPRDRPRGGKEAARTMLTVLRQMLTWGIDEDKINRDVNPAANMEKNLPKKKKGERVLSLEEAREAWRAAGDLGYPFGPAYQLDLLTGNRRGEWSKCMASYLDLAQGLQVIPAASYKSDHVHVMPLVPQAVQILNWVLTHHPRSKGDYIFSGTDGASPLSGWSKAQKRMRDAIYANTGALPKPWNPHDIRRTVATRIAEALGEVGDKLVKRVLGHADQEVTAIYNRYAYVKEMRHVLTQWTNELLATEKMYYVCGEPANVASGERPRPTSLAA